jgi:hypothetical protein
LTAYSAALRARLGRKTAYSAPLRARLGRKTAYSAPLRARLGQKNQKDGCAVRPPSALVTTCVVVVTIVLLFAAISGLAQRGSTDLPPLAPVDKAGLPKPKTLAEKSCCINNGDGYCATVDHGEINGVHYYAARKQRGCFPAHVASERTLSPSKFKQDDQDNCSCGNNYVFVPASQLLKASGDEDEMLVSAGLEENGLPRFIAPNEPFHAGDGTRLLQDFVVTLNDERWFRLFKIESWEPARGGVKPAAKLVVRFGQELDPSAKLKAAQQATLVESLGCFLKIRVGDDLYYVLLRGTGR